MWDYCRLNLLHIYAVEVDREKGFHLDVEDYLAGVLILASELVSFSLSLKFIQITNLIIFRNNILHVTVFKHLSPH